MLTDRPNQILMIALDSAEPRLIERWINDGTIPNLKRLRAMGSYGRLASTAKWLAGSPWPTFYTGTTPADHGVYHSVQWRADLMKNTQVGPIRSPLRPFWRTLNETDHKVVAIDMPMTFPPEPFNGVEIYGLVNRDLLGHRRTSLSYPPSLIQAIHQEFGFEANLPGDEVWGIQRLEELLRLRDQLIQGTRAVTDLAVALMKREKWDLFMVSFMATHRGGHKLWNFSNSWDGFDSRELSHALQDVYVACDRAVGRLAKVASDGVTILVFSLHGMGPNTSRSCLLPEMLRRIITTGKTEYSLRMKQRESLLSLGKLKEQVRMRTHNYLASSPYPLSLLYHKYSFLRARTHEKMLSKINWTTLPAFSLVADLQGYVRINLRGREVLGIVEPGNEYDQLCDKIAEGLTTFVDLDTRKPIVESVMRSDQLFKQGPRMKNLPDIIVRWSPTPAANHQSIVSSRYGSIPWSSSRRHPDGRSGNHGPEGFLLAVGANIKQNSELYGAHILDLAPTVYALLGIPKPDQMSGNVLKIVHS